MTTEPLEVTRDNYEYCHQVLMFGFEQIKFVFWAGNHDILMLEWCVERSKKRWPG